MVGKITKNNIINSDSSKSSLNKSHRHRISDIWARQPSRNPSGRSPPFAGAARSALLIRNAFAPSESRKTTPADCTWCTESCLKDPAGIQIKSVGWGYDVPEPFLCIVAHRIGSKRAGDCPQECIFPQISRNFGRVEKAGQPSPVPPF